MKSKPKYLSLPTLPAEWNAKPVTPLVRKELRKLLAKYKDDTAREARNDGGYRPLHLCNVVDPDTQHNAREWLRDIFHRLPITTGYFRAGIELPNFCIKSRELRILWLSAVIAGRKTFRMPIPVEEQGLLPEYDRVCSDCGRVVSQEDVSEEDGTTTCCWALVICPDMPDEEEQADES